MAAATLNGVTVTSCTVQIPAWASGGRRRDRPARRSSPAPSRSSSPTSRSRAPSCPAGRGRGARGTESQAARAVGQGHPAKPAYANDAGVKLSTVIGDAARECGETLGAIPTGTTGPHFVRAEGPASACCTISPRARGTSTRPGSRSSVAAQASPTRAAPRGSPPSTSRAEPVDLAPTTIADLLPGVVVDGIEAVDVEHTSTRSCGRPSGARASRTRRGSRPRSSASSRPSPRTSLLRPVGVPRGPAHGRTARAPGARVSSGMPDLRNVRVRPASPGCKGVPEARLAGPGLVHQRRSRPPGRDRVRRPRVARLRRRRHLPAGGRDGSAKTEHATSAEAWCCSHEQLLVALGAASGHRRARRRSLGARSRRRPSTRSRVARSTRSTPRRSARWDEGRARRPRSQQRPRTPPATRPRSAGRT
jgi:hypothetical protein